METINRTIIISEPITDQLASRVIEHLSEIEAVDEMARMHVEGMGAKFEPEPIEIYINSGGGSAHAGNAIIGAMEMNDAPIITYGLGLVASMALGIFASGDGRFAHHLARFMYHSVAYGEEGSIKDHIDSLEEVKIIQEGYDNIFKNNTKLSEEKMAEILKSKSNYFMSATEAMELGIADGVIDGRGELITPSKEEEVKNDVKEGVGVEWVQTQPQSKENALGKGVARNIFTEQHNRGRQ